jgi:hypothetical protein
MSADSRPRTLVVFLGGAVLAILSYLLYLPTAIRSFQAGSDYAKHAMFAEKIYRTHQLVVPHFLFHLLTIGVVEAAGASFQSAALFVLVVSYGLTGWLLYRETARVLVAVQSSGQALWGGAMAALVLGLAVLFMQPILRPGVPHVYQIGYLWAEPYGSPTYSLMKPLALASAVSALAFLTSASASRFAIVTAAIATAAGALAKPSFVICLLPAVVILGALRSKDHEAVDWKAITLGLLTPGAVILLLEYYLSYSGLGPQGTYQNAIVFAPLRFFREQHVRHLPAKLALSAAFPAAVYLLYWRCARRDFPLNFALLLFAFGAGYAYFLAEARNAAAGNLVWGAYVTLFILYLFSATFFVRHLKTASWTGTQQVRHVAAIALLLAHIGSGILAHVATLHQELGS